MSGPLRGFTSHWKRMPAATLGSGSGITPVQNTWYTVLDTSKNIIIKSLQLKHTNDESAAKTCGLRLTIDGLTLTEASNLGAGLWRTYEVDSTSEALIKNASYLAGYYISIPGKIVKVEARTTSAIGTNPKLFAVVHYEQLDEVLT